VFRPRCTLVVCMVSGWISTEMFDSSKPSLVSRLLPGPVYDATSGNELPFVVSVRSVVGLARVRHSWHRYAMVRLITLFTHRGSTAESKGASRYPSSTIICLLHWRNSMPHRRSERATHRIFERARFSPSGEVKPADQTNGETGSPEDSFHCATSIIGPESSWLGSTGSPSLAQVTATISWSCIAAAAVSHCHTHQQAQGGVRRVQRWQLNGTHGRVPQHTHWCCSTRSHVVLQHLPSDTSVSPTHLRHPPDAA
jgi:hypothetical protein